MSKSLTAEQIFSQDDRPLVKVPVPEWGGHVFVRAMTGDEVIEYAGLAPEKEPMAHAYARLTAFTACDQDGNRIFTKDHIERLFTARNYVPVRRIGEKAAELNLTDKSAVDDLEKNSEETPPSDSSPGSATDADGA